MDAVVMAAGRLPAPLAVRYGTAIKALVPIGETTPLQSILAALRASHPVDRILVVGPEELRVAASAADAFVSERPTGEENALAGLSEVRSRRALLCASDLPFVEAHHVTDFLDRIAPAADVAYPIFQRDEFLAVFPGGRSRFARVAGKEWTGGSLCALTTALALRNATLIRKAFRARKNPLSLAALFGARVVTRFVAGSLTLDDLERRLSSITGGTAQAVRHAHPALAMDCDDGADLEYACTHRAAHRANTASVP